MLYWPGWSVAPVTVFAKRCDDTIRKLSPSFPDPVCIPISDNVGVDPSDVVTEIVPTNVPSGAAPGKLVFDRDNPVMLPFPAGVICIARFWVMPAPHPEAGSSSAS